MEVWILTQYEIDIAYKEGVAAYHEYITSLIDNPYDGVSTILANSWEKGWWDAWYSE